MHSLFSTIPIMLPLQVSDDVIVLEGVVSLLDESEMLLLMAESIECCTCAVHGVLRSQARLTKGGGRLMWVLLITPTTIPRVRLSNIFPD